MTTMHNHTLHPYTDRNGKLRATMRTADGRYFKSITPIAGGAASIVREALSIIAEHCTATPEAYDALVRDTLGEECVP